MIHLSAATALCLALLLTGCATPPASPPVPQAWTPDEAWWVAAGRSGGEIVAEDGSLRRVKARHARNLHEVGGRIREQSGIVAEIALVDDENLNAFATDAGGRRRIALTLPFLEAVGDDLDALATSIGHEAAHLHYAHGATRRERNQPVIGDAVAIAGIISVNTTFSRYEEREADIKGIEWAVAAGFSPCGLARTLRLLEAHTGGTEGNRFGATHPGYRERIRRANALSKKLTGTGC